MRGTRREVAGWLVLWLLAGTVGPAVAQDAGATDPRHALVQGMFGNITLFWRGVFDGCGQPFPPLAFRWGTPAPEISAFGMRYGNVGLGWTGPPPGAAYIGRANPRYPEGLRGRMLVNPDRLFRNGDLAVEVLLAHEVGHRVQDLQGRLYRSPAQGHRLGFDEVELEADALAGAYVRWLEDQGRAPANLMGAGAMVLQTMGGLDHGSGEERAAAFLAGYRDGLPAGFCSGRWQRPSPDLDLRSRLAPPEAGSIIGPLLDSLLR